jgi:transitional endoplasmic reticulum ATPase
MKKEKTEIEKALKALEATLEAEHRAQQGITRTGDKLIIPEFMSFEDAISALTKFLEQSEEESNDRLEMRCHPADGLVAFKRAADAIFGNLMGASLTFNTFFGSFTIPSETRDVAIGYNETMNVPVGHCELPGIPFTMEIGVQEDTKNPRNSLVIVAFSYKRKFQPLIDKLKAAARKELREHSIFKGKAITSRFQFINVAEFPLEKIVYSKQEAKDLQANIFGFVENYDALCKRGMGGKRIVLLAGKYGTGKTLTSLKAADCAIKNGWTFINVLPGDDITSALNFAKDYQPAMVFFEDIDTVAGGERTEPVNNILNTIDGALSKSSKMIVVLTTNHVEQVSKPMMRPGRIDAVISLGNLDHQACEGLINVYLEGELEGELDLDSIVKAASGYTPAFMVEAIKKSVYYAGVDSKITSEALVYSLNSLRMQFELMEGEAHHKQPVLDVAMGDLIDARFSVQLDAFKETLNPRILRDGE